MALNIVNYIYPGRFLSVAQFATPWFIREISKHRMGKFYQYEYNTIKLHISDGLVDNSEI